ncbi:MAG TPA: hypothetical protein PKU80_03105 [Candidatus Limiplasma sp.]|nr:hypothetical protein [Candidatus Limiplasma sp.]
MADSSGKGKQDETSRFMKRMIVLSARTLICILIAAYVGYWFGKDMDTWLMVGCGAFSLELGYNAWIKLKERKQTSGGKTADETKLTKKVNG